ncbi:metallophosphoesterase family protein [Robbsia andropogonis]|uniref:metallophosphoesterase family protein n=1 Tax=Robbsia andropogonis TaxID=28092 RepID=UPI0004B68787|nr:metallophosphoesterase family protein [Robbsia andropogonis]
MAESYTIGIISDTHGLLRPEAEFALGGVDHILHAGDIGNAEILQRLSRIAPVTAIRGNNDIGLDWADAIPDVLECTFGRHTVYLIHSDKDLPFDPADAGVHVVVSGHSHKPLIREQAGVLFLNPGSAGPRRFNLPISIARLSLSNRGAQADIVLLDIPRTGTSITSTATRRTSGSSRRTTSS